MRNSVCKPLWLYKAELLMHVENHSCLQCSSHSTVFSIEKNNDQLNRKRVTNLNFRERKLKLQENEISASVASEFPRLPCNYWSWFNRLNTLEGMQKVIIKNKSLRTRICHAKRWPTKQVYNPFSYGLTCNAPKNYCTCSLLDRPPKLKPKFKKQLMKDDFPTPV